MSFRILLVEDDHSLAQIIVFHIQLMGHQVCHLSCGALAAERLKAEQFDLVLLDIMLPKVSGLDLCRQVREQTPQQNIIMLTALGSETDRIVGLELGADDYLAKPFSVRELQARITARLRRLTLPATALPHIISLGELRIDTQGHQVWVQQQRIDLALKEYELLLYLAQHADRVFNREQLLDAVWGYQFSGYEHTVNTHINRIRKKILPLDYVQTVWGVGYKLVRPLSVVPPSSEALL